MTPDIDTLALERVRAIVAPIAADLALDIYDIEHRGGILRISLDTPAGSEFGATLDKLALASRLVSKALDQDDPIASRYTLEVTSPGVERSLRVPAHFQREMGKLINIRLSDVEAADRRVRGFIVSADDDAVTLRLDDEAGAPTRTIRYHQIDRARTVFEWGPQPKPGVPSSGRGPSRSAQSKRSKETSS
ncbi:ribosome maturation factor RimP [soil metagenome]